MQISNHTAKQEHFFCALLNLERFCANSSNILDMIVLNCVTLFVDWFYYFFRWVGSFLWQTVAASTAVMLTMEVGVKQT